MNNRDYNNKNRDLQVYHNSLENYEESGNTQDDYRTDSVYNSLHSSNENYYDELGNTSEDGYTNPYYSERIRKYPSETKSKDYMPTFLIGAFLFFIFLLFTGIISFPTKSASKDPITEHPFMTLREISMPILEGKFESELQTADLAAVNHAISMGKVRLNRLYEYSKDWQKKTNETATKNDFNEYRRNKSGLDFNQYQRNLLEKELEMLEKKKLELEAIKK